MVRNRIYIEMRDNENTHVEYEGRGENLIRMAAIFFDTWAEQTAKKYEGWTKEEALNTMLKQFDREMAHFRKGKRGDN